LIAKVSTRKDSVNEINKITMDKLPGDFKCHITIDTVFNIEDTVHYPQEFLNSFDPAGLSPHEFKLKIGTSNILLRNLSFLSMCIGTRLLINELQDNVIIATIISGPATGQLTYIPRIPMIP